VCFLEAHHRDSGVGAEVAGGGCALEEALVDEDLLEGRDVASCRADREGAGEGEGGGNYGNSKCCKEDQEEFLFHVTVSQV